MTRATPSALATLSADEAAFFAAPADDLAIRLGQALAAALSARLRLHLTPTPCAAPDAAAVAHPVWRIDGTLAAVWLARRLGGGAGCGPVPFVPRGLAATLDAVLAERWLERPGKAPAVLAWRLDGCQAVACLALALPDAQAMTRWAREAIRA